MKYFIIFLIFLLMICLFEKFKKNGKLIIGKQIYFTKYVVSISFNEVEKEINIFYGNFNSSIKFTNKEKFNETKKYILEMI